MSNVQPEGEYQSTVPASTPMTQATPQTDPIHGLHNSAPSDYTVPPAKPEAVTGPGGASISIPKAGKTGA